MLINLPNVLLLQCAQAFLHPKDVVALAASASFPLRVLHSGYRIRELIRYWIQIDEMENCICVLDRHPTSKKFLLADSRIATLPLRPSPPAKEAERASTAVPAQSAGIASSQSESESSLGTTINSTSTDASNIDFIRKIIANEASPSVSSSTSTSSAISSPRFAYTRSRYRIGLPLRVEIELVQPKSESEDQENNHDGGESSEDEEQILEDNEAQGDQDDSTVRVSSRTSWFAHFFSSIFSLLRCRRTQQHTLNQEEIEEEDDEEEGDGEGEGSEDVTPIKAYYELDNLDFLPSTVIELKILFQLISPPIAKLKHLHNLTLLSLHTFSSHFKTPLSDWPPQLGTLALHTTSHNIPDERRIPPEFHLPDSISDLTISMKHFNRQWSNSSELDHRALDIQWPQFLTRLCLHDPDSSPLTRWQLPDSIEDLCFDYEYNGLITRLPSSLKNIDLNGIFDNSSLSEMPHEQWPQQLETFSFGYGFQQDISSMRLPHSVTTLNLGREFNQSLLDFQFPSALKELYFPFYWSRPNELAQISAHLPATLERLVLGYSFYESLTGLILPPRLTELDLGGAADGPTNTLVLPDSIIHLALGRRYNQSVSDLVLPSRLESLYFGDEWNQPPQSLLLPSTLTRLNLGGIDHSLTGMKWPPSLTDLTLGYAFSQPLSIGDLPSSLQNFTIRNRPYSHPLIDCILALPHLTNLWLSWDYIHSSSLLQLPESICCPCKEEWQKNALKQ